MGLILHLTVHTGPQDRSQYVVQRPPKPTLFAASCPEFDASDTESGYEGLRGDLVASAEPYEVIRAAGYYWLLTDLADSRGKAEKHIPNSWRDFSVLDHPSAGGCCTGLLPYSPTRCLYAHTYGLKVCTYNKICCGQALSHGPSRSSPS